MSVLELLLACLLLGATGAVAVGVLRAGRETGEVAAASARLHVIAAENARMAKSVRDLTRAVDTTTAAVDVGTNIVRVSHTAIAAIPFGVLAAIPATRETSRIVRGIHDGTSTGVYRAILGVNRVIGEAVRDAVNPKVTGPQVPEQVIVERVEAVVELPAVVEERDERES